MTIREVMKMENRLFCVKKKDDTDEKNISTGTIEHERVRAHTHMFQCIKFVTLSILK